MRKIIRILAGVMIVLSAKFPLVSGSVIHFPEASGVNVRRNGAAEIDYSNARDGYVTVRFTERADVAVRVIITAPDEARSQYHLNTNGVWEVFPLTGGNGQYTVGVFRQVHGNRYASENSVSVNVILTDEFAPFLRPNQFVDFNPSSRAVAIAAELTANSQNVIERVAAVYNYVVENIEYDFELAENVRSGYVPDLDSVLMSGRGICFDYAALMTAMLRSLRVPTKLVVGYAGNVFHAWISVYSVETGWINNIIWFNGTDWQLMDPTFASTANQSADAMEFIGDGLNYNPTNLY